MKASQLKPASQLAQRFGVKMICFGGPGTAKTPLIETAPNPVLCAVEPGLMTMRNSNIPTWEADTPAKIEEFFTWLVQSNEAKSFDTVGIDSGSELAEKFLEQELVRNKHGLQAYGEMARRTFSLMQDLYYMPQKHVYIIAKEGTRNQNGTETKFPFFPGNDLNTRIPHLYDEVIQTGRFNIPGVPGGQQLAFRTKPTFDAPLIRDRSGKLAEFEQPHLGNLIQKCMS